MVTSSTYWKTHFIVFHYVIVCFIAFHQFFLVVGGGTDQKNHFPRAAALRATHCVPATQSSPAPLSPFPAKGSQAPDKPMAPSLRPGTASSLPHETCHCSENQSPV